MAGISLFGFEIGKKKDEEELKSFVEPNFDDGAVNVTATSVDGIFGTSFVDMEGTAKNEAELISKYRSMEQQPEVSKAVDDIVNDAIVISDDNRVVDINLDDADLSDKIKKLITEEFENVLKLLDFSNRGYEIFLRWYVDGRIRYHVVIDERNSKNGIQELRYVDPRKLRKIKEIEKTLDNKTDAILKRVKNEYWIYNDRGFNIDNDKGAANITSDASVSKGVKVAKDSIVESNSGILNENNTLVLSHLHKSLRVYNQLRMLEDASVIYRLARAPERRVFYIDVGNLPKMKAEQYLRDMMVKHKNRLVYDASTGEVRDDRRHMTMTEDFWLPRREGGRGTEISPLPGGQNLGEMEDIVYFQKNLYKSLNVPVSRMETDTGFSLGRASEITRDEVKFARFISRLRSRFSILFDEILEKQVVLKNIMTLEEWKEIKDVIRYDFKKDSHFEELKEGEIIRERVQNLNEVDPFVGVYYSKEWVRKNILMLSEEEIEDIKKQIEVEEEEEPDEDEDGDNQWGGGNDDKEDEDEKKQEKTPPPPPQNNKDDEEDEDEGDKEEQQEESFDPLTEKLDIYLRDRLGIIKEGYDG